MMNRRHFLTVSASTAALAIATSAHAADAPKQLRIGYQKNGVLLVAKQQQVFEKRFGPLGIEVKFVEFSSGPPLLEALNTGSLDYGTTGDSPPIFAQAARANLLYVAALPSGGSTSGILVKDDAPLRSLADLKGRKVAFTKASSAHNLTVAALEQAGLTYADITPVYLQPADAAAAFARGSIDAWTIWDPYFAIAQTQPGTRLLKSGRDIARQNSYFLANRDFTTKYPHIIGAVNDELAKASRWTSDHRDEASTLFAAATGIPLDIQKTVVARSDFLIAPVNDGLIAEQQAVADRFHHLKLIPDPIKVRDIVWTWAPSI
jgi:sulfonate transport system substrate-binding protein